MLTRYPRIPNVKFATSFSHPSRKRALVQVAALESRHTLTTTLKAPIPSLTTNSTSSQVTIALYPRLSANMDTDILGVDPQKLGEITFTQSKSDLIDEWDIQYADGKDYQSLKRAAEEIVNTDTPVAFPTETVYGLGADATRSSAVKAIFAAKGRPSDNPLIVHIHSLPQLRELLSGKPTTEIENDPIPAIYRPLIERFWPGPLTIILPVPENTVLAPEVTAGLPTFGARMPRSILALSLLRLCNRPLAGPSANASTRPSPTAAEHVFDDLRGRIHTIIDGGPCEVGVESTVVDGLSSPPSILRPGGVTVEQLRQCRGWENVTIGYKDQQESGASKPRAPGMKYRHYSPKAAVILFEAGAAPPATEELTRKTKVGLIRTKTWIPALGLSTQPSTTEPTSNTTPPSPPQNSSPDSSTPRPLSNLLRSALQHQIPRAQHHVCSHNATQIWDISLGAATEGVARGLFSALRELDKEGVEVIFVEGIDDKSGDDIAAAVMNRLRKAAEVRM